MKAVIFVLPGLPGKYPAGGYRVVTHLAEKLVRMGYPAGIAYLGNTTEGQWLGPVYGAMHLDRSRYAYDELRVVPQWFVGNPCPPPFEVEYVFATAWTTAEWVYRLTDTMDAEGGYLIQGQEDDPLYCGEGQVRKAAKTYSYPLRHVVVSKALQMAHPGSHRIHVGIDHRTTLQRTPPEKKISGLLVPLHDSARRGVDFALSVIGKLQRDYPQFPISAYGSLPEEKVPKGIRWLSNPTEEEKSRMHNEVAVFFLPSQLEGFSVVGIEAMAMGNAVVATAGCGYTEDPEIPVLIVPYGHTDRAVGGIVGLLESPFRDFSALSTKGIKIAKRYTYERMAKEFLEAL